MRRTVVLGIVVLVAAATTGCTVNLDTLVGSGTAATEDRQVADFTELTASAAIGVTVTIGSPVSVRVTADDNLLSHVRTSLSGGRLDVSMQGPTAVRTPVKVEITVPALTSISATSAASVTVNGLAAQALTVRVDSAGVVTANGSAASLDVYASSGGVAQLSQLPAGPVRASLDSAGLATINASGAVTGRATTGAVLTIQGSPTSVEVTADAGGQVIRP